MFYSYTEVHPPSTKIEVPVIIEEESEARKATAVATSLTSANLPKGILFRVSLLNFLFFKKFFCHWCINKSWANRINADIIFC